MKTIQKENRVEQINDTDLADAVKRGWREIDPKTGEPVPRGNEHRPIAELEAENARLRDRLTELEAQLAKEKADVVTTGNHTETTRTRGKGKPEPAKDITADSTDVE